MTGRARPRRILLVTNLFGWAGAERQLEHLAAGLARAGHSVVVLAIGKRWVDLAPLEAEGVEVVTLGIEGKLGKLRALPTLRRYARAAEVVHCTGWDATLWGRLAAVLARRPALFTEHTPGRESQTKSFDGSASARTIGLHNRLLDRFTYAAIAVGAWQRELLEGEGVRPESIVHIPNGVPIAELREEAAAGPDRTSLGLPAQSPVVIQVSRFAPQKHHEVTLRAVERVRAKLGDVRLVFVGGGFDEDKVKALAAEIGADWTTFLGFRDDVAAMVALADLSVLPSSAEGLPMSLIETLAVGTPIVATRVGDVGWFLDVTGAGIGVEAGDEEAFTAACEKVLGDPELHRSMVAAAERGAAQFDSGLMVERYEQVFEAAIVKARLPIELAE